jgi:transcriptional regulator with PAS, ATPase and Fis domain
MSAQRLNATELARLLNSAPEPIYVLDDDLRVVFINRACQEWLGNSAEGLLGCRCAYHSSSNVQGAEAVAARLCPPPDVLAGKSVCAMVSCIDGGGAVSKRLAKFLPLASGGESVLGVMALLEPADASPPSEVSDAAFHEPTPIVLHEQIMRFRQEAASRYRVDRLIGTGPAMQLARRKVELAVGSRCSVFLTGPTGSGREHLAAAIHYGANWPTSGSLLTSGLVSLDCSLLGRDILEFLVAAVTKLSALGDAAASCSILFHRIDALSADVQAELAAMLGRLPPSLRLMATAASPSSELVGREKFRSDLAAVLSTIEVVLPSLAQRREDIPLLAQMFLEETNAAGTRQIGGFTVAALDAMDAYPWHGNLDELAEVVAESHRHAAGVEIDVGDLPEKLHWAAHAAAYPRRSEETIVLDEYLARVERELIRRALARSKGNKARAARLLGMTRPRLYRRMVQLGLE